MVIDMILHPIVASPRDKNNVFVRSLFENREIALENAKKLATEYFISQKEGRP